MFLPQLHLSFKASPAEERTEKVQLD
jgi:hypothetical protein